MIKMSKLLIVMIVFALTGLYSADYHTAGANTLRIGISTFPFSLNPVYATNETASAVVNKVFDALYYFDSHGSVRKCLTESAHVGEKIDHLEIVLQLRKNIFFSNGKELDAEDVVETVKLLKNKDFSYPYVSTISVIKEITQINRYTVKLILTDKVVAWENYLTFKILNAWDIKKAKPGPFRDATLTGTGPYRLKAIENQSKILLERNPMYRPTVPRQMYTFLEFSLVAYTQLSPLKLLGQEIDVCELQPEHIEAYKKTESWRQSFSVLKYKKFGYSYLVFNLKNPAITKNIRKLFYNLLIWGDFTTRFLNGRGERLVTPFIMSPGSTIPERRETAPLNDKISFKILINTESKLRKEFALFLAQKVKPLHIELKIVALEYHSFLEYLKNGRFDMALSGFVLDIGSDVGEIFQSDSAFNYASFKNQTMDKLLKQGRLEKINQKQAEIYKQAYRIWLEELPLIPIFDLFYNMGISKRIQIPAETYQLVGSAGDFLFNIQEWGAPKMPNSQ